MNMRSIAGLTAGAVGALVLSASAEFGPVANEADQFRGIWGFDFRAYEDIRDAGALFEIGSDAHKTGATFVIQTRTEFAQHLGLQEDRHWKPAMRDNRGGRP